MAWRKGCPCQGCRLEGIDHSDVQGSISPSCPVGDENICWPPIISLKEESALFRLSGGQARRDSHLKESVTKVVCSEVFCVQCCIV